MPEIDLSDFRGGVNDALSASDFTARQWSELSGVLLEVDDQLRTQWQVVPVAGRPTGAPAGALSAGAVDGFVAVNVGGDLYGGDLAADGSAAGVTLALLLEGVGGVRAGATVPVQIAGSWVSGVLFNSVEQADTSAVVVYRDPALGTLATKVWTARYPGGSPTTDSMPHANVAGSWGDFLLLGDVRWAADDGAPLTEANSTRRRNGLWFSQPAVLDSWDAIDLEPLGNADGENTVMAAFPVDVGLLVLTSTGVFLLRGTANQYGKEQLRAGVGPQAPENVCYWPAAGVVAWTDGRGQVWHTNGSEFGRLDRPLPEASSGGPVTALGDHLFAVRDGRLWAFRLDGGDGAWTEIAVPAGRLPVQLFTYRQAVYGVAGDGVWKASPLLPSRGLFDGAEVTVRVATATLSVGDGHTRTGWHRFGARCAGPGRLTRAEGMPRPRHAAPGPSVVYAGGSVADERQLQVWPAHGPSVEAAFVVEAAGDVTFEGMTVWHHAGKAER